MIFDQVEELIPRFYQYCFKLTGSSWDAEDLVQEALVRTLAFQQKNPERDIHLAYLFSVARNVFYDKKRRSSKTISFFSDDRQAGRDLYQYSDLVDLFIRTLPLKEAMLVALKDVFLFKVNEIAPLLRMSDEAVRTALHRARKSLKSEQTAVEYQAPDLFFVNELATAIKNEQPMKLFYCYRMLSAAGFKTGRHQERSVFFLVDPDGMLLEIAQP